MNLSTNDKMTLEKKGISTTKIEEQLNAFATGFPYLEIRYAAEPGKGVVVINAEKMEAALTEWESYLQSSAKIIKFVPASGAASRMFKDLFEFLEKEPQAHNSFEQKFFGQIDKFAFYEDLNEACLLHEGKTITELVNAKEYKAIVKNLLEENGLNYGALPKGLLKFHSYANEKRTPTQEHMVEGALYASTNANVNIHFTVSTEHKALFQKHISETIESYQKKFNTHFEISFSEQKPSTDTIAADADNQAFRDNGELVFRPGGHGALIENLNDLDADIVFIKNIDNVVPDSLKPSTTTYKKVIAGILVRIQKQCFAYLKELENTAISRAKLDVIAQYCLTKLSIIHPNLQKLSDAELRNYLVQKLNRPIRVCGMVKNVGEPGGGPFITVNPDGTASPQILESSQINLNNPSDKEKMLGSTHFNPVDLVCTLKNYKAEKFDLLKYVDKNTGFISLKSKNGKELKALELPGLWNGAMSDWNTIFVEVPIDTFNPVKTVNDLLRPEHQ